MSKWSYISSSGVHLIKCQPDPTSSSKQISTWLDLKPHLGEHIWPNVNLILHLLWPNVNLILHLIWPNVKLALYLIFGGHLIKWRPDLHIIWPNVKLALYLHIWEYIWSNDNLTLHYHLTKCWPDPTQSLILGGTSYQVSTLPYISSDQMSKWSYISSSGVHLIKCQPDPTSYLTKCQPNPTSHLTKCQSGPTSHLGGTSDQMLTWSYIWSDQMSNCPSVSSLGVHLTKCQPNPTSHLTKCQSGPTSHLQEYIWSNVDLTLHLHLTKYQPDLTQSLILDGTSDQMSNWLWVSSLGAQVTKCQPNPTFSSDQMSKWSYISSWGDIWSNVDLTLHFHLTKCQSCPTSHLGGTSDQMLTWPYIFIWPNINLTWPKASSWMAHLTKCQPNPTSHLTKCQSGPTSHLQEYIWSNVNLTLHLHLSKYQPD